MVRQAQLFLGGDWVDGVRISPLHDKYSGELVAEVHEASAEQVATALDGVARGQGVHRLTPYERYEILSRTAQLLRDRREDVVDTVVTDTGFTLADARREADRAVQTLILSGEEAKRIHGEMVPWDSAPGAVRDRYAFTLRRPLGVVCAITPFNSPLNTLVHKVAPALAAGNGVVVKPASYTPLSAGLLARTLLEAGLPESLIAVVHGGGSTVGQWLLESPVPAFYAFTGSTEVGEHIQRTVGLRRTQLEMGSLSSTVVCEDADLVKAATACVNAAFRKAGQVCTSVQRLYVHASAVDAFAEQLTGVLSTVAAGNPRDEKTLVGPLISEADAVRVSSWVDRAVRCGASVLAGGARQGTVVEPTVLSDVRADMEVHCREIFGPVVAIRPYGSLDDALTEINDTPYGLSAGIFTADLAKALDAVDTLRMGSVHINETSSNRVDLMPYGGVKQSGLGIEGPRYAIHEMTEQRLITLARP